LSVLKYFDDRRKQVVSAQASHPRGSSEVGGEIQEQRYAPKRVLREFPKNLIAATPHDNIEQDEDEAFWPGPVKSASRQEIKYWRDGRLPIPIPLELPTSGLERSRSAADASREANGAVVACWLR
jgi:hypothetical protein